MKLNPYAPQFIRHEVPDDACDNSKLFNSYYSILIEDVEHDRWPGFYVADTELSYNADDECTYVGIVFRDDNNHFHYFTMQFIPDNGGDGFQEDEVILRYMFEGDFHEDVRSFSEYLAVHIEHEGFEPQRFLYTYPYQDNDKKYKINYNRGFDIICSVQNAYESMCKLIDITLSKIKPLLWFYSDVPDIVTIEERYYYLAGVKSRLQLESVMGRWQNVKPECFNLIKYCDEGGPSLILEYIVDDVWELSLSVVIAVSGNCFDYSCAFDCFLDANLSDEVKKQLHVVFADFLSNLKSAQGNTYLSDGSVKGNSLCIKYFYIDDTFDILCEMLDVIVPALHSFNFQLSSLPAPQPVVFTGEIDAIKEQVETALNMSFEVVTEVEQINRNLKRGYFRTYPPFNG